MSGKMKTFLCLLQVLLLSAGMMLVARPIYRFCHWKYKDIRGWVEWENREIRVNEMRVTGQPAVWLRVRSVDLNTLVLHGANEENLFEYPCLDASGFVFGHKGTKVVLGHRDLRFRRLKGIHEGDLIEVELPDEQVKVYCVVGTEIIGREEVETRLNFGDKEDHLVLMTCYPFKYIGPAPLRFLVFAKNVLERE